MGFITGTTVIVAGAITMRVLEMMGFLGWTGAML
jgi:hypothetical protein